MNIGPLLRKTRKEKGLTLKNVSEKAGVSEGFLSQIENSVKSPSLDTLFNICGALGVGAGDLINQAQGRETMFVIRREEWDETDLPHTGFATRRFVSPDERSIIDTAVLFIQPSKSIPVRKNLKNGQEVLCVLKGALELSQGEKKVLLGEGDVVHFWSQPERQSITNPGPGQTVAFWLGTI